MHENVKHYQSESFIDGIYFGESPRWHGNKLWFSDFYDKGIYALDENGSGERLFEVENQPSGLGWLPDGRLLVISMVDKKILVEDGESLKEYADLSEYHTFLSNDMVVSSNGIAYAGNFGFDLDEFLEKYGPTGIVTPPGPPLTNVVKVDTDRNVSVAANEMSFPNGSVIFPDNKSIVIGESTALRLTAFDINDDGSLSNRRVWADLSSYMCVPDGCCLDSEGRIWVANALMGECLLIEEGGAVKGRVETGMTAFACMLGGEDRKSLFIMTAPISTKKIASAERKGTIEVAKVDVEGAGLP